MRRTVLDTLFALAALGVPFIFMATYWGPYQWLAEAQLGMWQSYDVKLTLVLTMVLWMGLLFGGSYLIALVVGQGQEVRAAFGSLNELAPRLYVAGTIAAPLVLLGVAGYFQHLAESYTQPTAVDLADLYAGKPVPSPYLRLTNVAIATKAAQALEKTGVGENGRFYYLPLVPARGREVSRGVGIPVFLEVKAPLKGAPVLPEGTELTGITALTGLPGEVRCAFERERIPLAGGYVVLLAGQTPASWASMARGMFFAAGAVAVVGVIVIVRQGRAKAARRPEGESWGPVAGRASYR